MVYFLDWGLEYLTNVKDICKMPKDFVYLPATAHKCYLKGMWVHKNIVVQIKFSECVSFLLNGG